MKRVIFLGSDHAGFALKEVVRKHLEKKGERCVDLGAFSSKASDYPDFIFPVARKVSKTRGALGIIFGGSGQGEAIAANKIKGIRATVFYGGLMKIVKLSKEHNDANVLSLGARFLKEREALRIVQVWLKTNFSGDERHKRRLRKISKVEK